MTFSEQFRLALDKMSSGRAGGGGRLGEMGGEAGSVLVAMLLGDGAEGGLALDGGDLAIG
jgi:hypothetical protein